MRSRWATLSLKTWHALIVAVVAAVLVVALASNRHTISDPDGTLLVAQAIVDHRTVQLDVYEPDLSKRLLYQIHRKNDHT